MGWARAQLVYDLLKKPPPYGSLLELMCLIVQRERAQIAVLGARAQAQAAIGGENAETAFRDYMNAVRRVEVEDVKLKMQAELEKLKSIKEIRFTPIGTAEKKVRLPTVSAQTLREVGTFSEQMSPLRTVRPARARTKRTAR